MRTDGSQTLVPQPPRTERPPLQALLTPWPPEPSPGPYEAYKAGPAVLPRFHRWGTGAWRVAEPGRGCTVPEGAMGLACGPLREAELFPPGQRRFDRFARRQSHRRRPSGDDSVGHHPEGGGPGTPGDAGDRRRRACAWLPSLSSPGELRWGVSGLALKGNGGLFGTPGSALILGKQRLGAVFAVQSKRAVNGCKSVM